MMSIVKRVEKKVEDLLTEGNYDLVAVEYVKEGSERVLRVFIENREGDLDLDDCARLSHRLSDWLDEENFISESYILEISSPGVERPLRGRDDYQRFSGESVFIKTYAPIKGEKEFTGKLLGLKKDLVRLEMSEDEIIELPLKSIAAARLNLDI